MKHLALVVVLLAPVAAQADNAELVGLWQASPEVGSGYDDSYLFMADGTYEWHLAQGACKRGVQARGGTWSLSAVGLKLSETWREELKGGRIVSDDVGCEIKGAKTKKKVAKKATVKTLKLGACDPNEDAPTCKRFGKAQHWRVAEDPKLWYGLPE